MRRILALVGALLLFPLAAQAQNALPAACTPIVTYGVTPTALQMQACLSAIYNGAGSGGSGSITAAQVISALTYTPLNKAGDTMTGKLGLPASTSLAAPLNIGGPGTSPTSPSNGDIWMNSTSAYLEFNGAAHDLLSTISSASGDCTGTVSGGVLPLTCGAVAHLGSPNAYTSSNTFQEVILNYVTYNSNTTLSTSNNLVCGDVSGGAITLTMPPGTGTSIPNGFTIVVKDCKRQAGTNHLTVNANAGQTIEGAASQVIATSGSDFDAVWNSATNNWDLF